MKIATLIVDDEPLARSRLRRLLNEIDKVEVVGEAEDGEEAVRLYQSLQPELILMDIKMPNMSGLKAAKTILSVTDKPPAIVFCTAFDEYAIEAFRLHAANYLLKPVSLDELRQTIAEASQLTQLQIDALAATESTSSPVIARGAKSIMQYRLDDILYFRALDKHTVAGLTDGKEIVIDKTLKEIQAQYDDLVIRIHRNSLINAAKIAKLYRDDSGSHIVELQGITEKFTVSRRSLRHVKASFNPS